MSEKLRLDIVYYSLYVYTRICMYVYIITYLNLFLFFIAETECDKEDV